MAELTINVVESPSQPDNGFCEGVASRVTGELRATSVKDMVKKVLNKVKKGDCIKQLNLIGHGRGGNISVGDGQVTEAGKHINGKEEDWKPDVLKLKGKFCKGGSLRLLGCNTGVCDAGAAKLHKLANLLGVTVHGTNRTIYPSDFGADGYTGGDDSLVHVDPGEEKPPACLASNRTSGLRKAKKPTTPGAEHVRAFGVRDVRAQGAPPLNAALSFPFGPGALDALLSYYDLSTTYVADGLAADIDALVYVLHDRNVVEPWEITLDGFGLVVHRVGGSALFAAREGSDPNEILRELAATQETSDALLRTTTGIDTRGTSLLRGDFARTRQQLNAQLAPDSFELTPAQLLEQPLTVVRGIAERQFQALQRQLGITTLGEAARLCVDTSLTRLARTLARMAEMDARSGESR